MGDIAVQRGTIAVGNGGTSAAPPTAFGSLSSTIVFNSNNRRMQGGRDDQNTGNLEVDDMSGGIHLAATNSIEFDREGGSQGNNMRFAWESWEYTGTAAGANEFIVRGRVKLTLTGETTTSTISGITNIDDCIPIITGILSNATVDDADSATAIAWMSGTDQLNVKRGSGSNNTVQVYVTVVEFTGSSWSVYHGRLESNADSGTVTLVDDADGQTAGGGDVGDWSRAIIHHQFVANALNGIDDSISDTSAVYFPGSSTSTVDWAFDAGHVDSAAVGSRAEHFMHALHHPAMTVTRFTDSQSLTGVMNVNIASAGIGNIAEASIEVSRRSSGGGTAYGRGWVNGRLTSTTNAELWVHRSGNTIQTRIQVIDLAGIANIAITDMEDEQIDDGENNNVIDGFGFEAVQGTGKVELVENANYSGTIVLQTITAWADTQITFNSVKGALGDGTAYLFVTNDSGERSSGYAVNLGAIPYDVVVSALSPDHLWQLDNSYDDSAGSVDMTTDIVGTHTFNATPICEKNTHAWELNSVTERRGCADNPEMNITNAHLERTMGGWIQVDSVQQSLGVFYKEGGAVNNLAFIFGMGNVLMAQLADTSDDQAQAYSDFRLAVDRPYHILFRYSYNENPAEFRLYIDGVEQSSTDGNPLTSTNMDSHSGDINWGDPDNNLEMGGTDIAFAGTQGCLYAQWATWTRALNKPDEIRVDLFEKGALPDVTISSNTEANMQIALDAIASTVRPDWPLAIRVEAVSGGGDLTLTADNIVFDERVSIHVQYTGSDTLNWINANGSNASIGSVTGGGTINFQEAVPIVITVRDVTSNLPVQDARVYLTASSGGDLPNGTVLVNDTTNASGQVSTSLVFTSNQPVSGRVRRGSVPPFYKPSAISGTVTSSGFSPTIFMVGD